MRYCLLLIIVAGLSACGGGGGSSGGAEPPVSSQAGFYDLANPPLHTSNFLAVVFIDEIFDGHDTAYYTQLFDEVAACMGLGSDYPRVYVVDSIPGIDGVGYEVGVTYSSATNGASWINVLPVFNDRILSHEFIHYILYWNGVRDTSNTEHTAWFFEDCEVGPTTIIF